MTPSGVVSRCCGLPMGVLVAQGGGSRPSPFFFFFEPALESFHAARCSAAYYISFHFCCINRQRFCVRTLASRLPFLYIFKSRRSECFHAAHVASTQACVTLSLLV